VIEIKKAMKIKIVINALIITSTMVIIAYSAKIGNSSIIDGINNTLLAIREAL